MAETFLHTVVAAATEYAIDVDNIVGNEYGWATISGTSCNDCVPPLPTCLLVTLTGLAGDFAEWNGSTAVPWVSGCTWAIDIEFVRYVQLKSFAWGWEVWLLPGGYGDPACEMVFRLLAEDRCEVTGSYSFFDCDDAACDDTDSCENSAGATCVVSLT